MNSLYKLYTKKAFHLLFIGILFSVFLIYITHSNYNAHLYYIADIDTWLISQLFSEYTSSCFLLNIILVLILTYNFYAHRNKKTGVFIRQLPIKSSNDFITKVLLSIVFICLLVAFEIAVFNLFTKGFIYEQYKLVEETYMAKNTVIQSLEEMYSSFYQSFITFASLTLFFSASLIFFSSCIGVTVLALAMPFISYVGFIGFIVGSSAFARDTRIRLTAAGNFILSTVHKLSSPLSLLRNLDFNTTVISCLPFILLSVILFIIAFYCNKYINYSKIGKLFIFKWAKIITYILGCIWGGFSLYFFAGTALQPDTDFISAITLLICTLLSYIIIKKTENLFI